MGSNRKLGTEAEILTYADAFIYLLFVSFSFGFF